MVLPKQEKIYAKQSVSGDHSRQPGHGNLYRLSPIYSSLVKLTTHLSIVARLGSSGALRPLLYTPSRRAQAQFHLNISVSYLRRTLLGPVPTLVNQILVST